MQQCPCPCLCLGSVGVRTKVTICRDPLHTIIHSHPGAQPGDPSILRGSRHQPTAPVLKWGMLWQEVSRLGSTMYFGELALLNNEPRKASVKVSSMALLNVAAKLHAVLGVSAWLHWHCQQALCLVMVISGVRMPALLAVGTVPPVTCQPLSLEQHHPPVGAACSPAVNFEILALLGCKVQGWHSRLHASASPALSLSSGRRPPLPRLSCSAAPWPRAPDCVSAGFRSRVCCRALAPHSWNLSCAGPAAGMTRPTNDTPCAQAATSVDLLALSRADFQRLLGPLQDLLTNNASKYAPLTATSQKQQVRWCWHQQASGEGWIGGIRNHTEHTEALQSRDLGQGTACRMAVGETCT